MLDEFQKIACEITDKPLIIIGSSGTGKTNILEEKINYLIEKKQIDKKEILFIKSKKDLSLLANKVIEKYISKIPQLDKIPKIIDKNNQLIFFLENLLEFNIKSIEIKNNHTTIAKELQSEIETLKNLGYDLKAYEKIPVKDMTKKMDILFAYSKYELWKKKNNFIDNSDLYLYLIELLENEKIRKEIQKRYKYILIDNFEKITKIQLEVLKLISFKKNITITYDENKNIQRVENKQLTTLDSFKSYYSDFKEIKLNKNYKFSNEVLKIIKTISNNIYEKSEILESDYDMKNIIKGEIKEVTCSSELSQKTYLADKISLTQDLYPNSSIGILCRQEKQILEISDFLSEIGLKHEKKNEINFFDLDIIKEIIGIFTIINKPKDESIYWFNILENAGLNNEVIKKIFRISKIKEKSILDVFNKYMNEFEDNKERGCKKEDYDMIVEIYSKMQKLVDIRTSKLGLYHLIRETIFELNLYQKSHLSGNKKNIDILNMFLNFTKDYTNKYKSHELNLFLKYINNAQKLNISIFNKDDNLFENNNNGLIEILTIENSENKEFDFVFIPYLNQRILPISFKRGIFDLLELDDKIKLEKDEKKQLYIASSRAKRSIYLSYTKRIGESFSQKSSLLNMFKNIDKEEFEREMESLEPSVKESVVLEITEKITSMLLNHSYKNAQDQINLLKELFEKKQGLTNFMVDSEHHLEYDFYKNRLKGIKKQTKLDNINFNAKTQVYSVSQLKTYEQCPKKYLYSYVYKIPSEPKHFFDFGTTVHSVFEDLVEEFEKYDDTILYAKGISMLKQKWISKGYIDENQEKEYLKKAFIAIKDFISTQRELLKDKDRKIYSQEEKFIVNMHGRQVMGFIDRIDVINGEFEILDYKTSNSMMTKPQLKQDLQLYVYSEAVKKLKGKYPESVGLWYAIFNEIKLLKKEDINFIKLKEKMIDLFEGIERKDFRAKPSNFNCTYCDYNKICNKK